ncbi:MAG TPA: hypothetical protein VNR11_03320 [Xanthobacteraceae bacterium]|nr:hypothetical protein [Xanthobacteraceae bacterium]
MASLIAGIVVLIATGIAFVALLPRGGRMHRWVDTAWEPYVAVALCAGVALTFTLVLSGAIDLASG